MTIIENAREFMKTLPLLDYMPKEKVLSLYSKHVLQQVISFLEANEKKPIKSIINELKGKV